MKISNEAKVGILITIVLAILFGLTWKSGNYRVSQKSYMITVVFKNVDGVELNSPVMLNGFEIGRVRKLEVAYGDDPHVQLTLWLKGEIKIPKGSKAMVKNMGFMGEKYIGLIMPSGNQGYLAPGETIVGENPASFENIMQEGEAIAKNVKEISQQLNERLRINSAAFDDVVGNMRITMKNVASLSTTINERFDVNKLAVDEMVGNLNSTTRNLEEMSCDLKANPWKLLYKPKKECSQCLKAKVNPKP